MKKLKIQDLAQITGGLSATDLAVKVGNFNNKLQPIIWEDGCSTGVCVNNRDVGAKYCEGSAVCTNGIDVCQEKTS